jgi:hypothetical protein
MGESENKSSQFDTIAWVVAIAFIGLLAFAIVIPNLAKQTTSAQPCIANLRELDLAKQQWAVENGKTNGAVCGESDIKQFVKLDSNGNLPKCPQGGIYTIGKVGEPVTCSLGKTNRNHVLP